MPHSLLSTGLPILSRLRRTSNSLARNSLPEIIVAADLDARVVAPLIRIADLVGDRGQLGEACCFGGLGHPGCGLDILLHGLLDFVDQLQRLGFRGSAESDFDIFLPKSFAERAVGCSHASLPARLNFFGAGERLAEEIEVFVHKRLGQRNGGIEKHAPGQVSLEVVQAGLVQNTDKLFEELGIADVDFLEGRRSFTGEEGGPLEVRA